MKEILLVDDHAMIRDAIKQYLSKNKEFKIVDEAGNGNVAIELMRKRQYDLVITDLSMPECNGTELIKIIKEEFPDQAVIVLSMDYDSHTVNRLVKLGIKGYLFKNVPKDEFIEALKIVSKGGLYFSKKVAEKINILNLNRQVIDKFKTMSLKKKIIVTGKLLLEGASIIYL